ncbi:MAG: hypothetical protein IKA55_07160 [Akkermansia sp.]|nr:hypothetical protein [Akkermansia sp.]
MNNYVQKYNNDGGAGQQMQAAPMGGMMPMGGGLAAPGGALAAIQGNAEVMGELASIYIAKSFPRNLNEVTARMRAACSRAALAEVATYSYPRGGQTVTGPSIRLAEALASAYGNIEAGWRELSRHTDALSGDTFSECEAFCFDKEANIRRKIQFTVPHVRDKKKGTERLTSERDIYENNANMASRRIRACILQVLPGFLVDEALALCEETLNNNNGGKPMCDRIREMVARFSELGVTQQMLEEHLEHPLEQCVQAELVRLGRTFNALRDGQVRVSEVFQQSEPERKGGMSSAAAPAPLQRDKAAAAGKAAPEKADKSAAASAPLQRDKVNKEPELMWPEERN